LLSRFLRTHSYRGRRLCNDIYLGLRINVIQLNRRACASSHDLYWVEAMTHVRKVHQPPKATIGSYYSLRQGVLNLHLRYNNFHDARTLNKCRRRALLRGNPSYRRTTVHASAPPATADKRDVARLGVDANTTVYVEELLGNSNCSLSIDHYMKLPPEQYSALEPTLISHLEKNRFRLRVPKLKLYGLWVAPVVDIVATQLDNPAKVVLTSENCILQGSQWVRKVGLNDFLTVRFRTELSWTSSRTITEKVSKGSITGIVFLEVMTHVIPPFNLIPRPVLEGTVNAILRGLIRTMLPFFLHRLAADYQRWATDAEYRAFRESMGREMK
jgi:hypothetical protein